MRRRRMLPFVEWVRGRDEDHQLYVSIRRLADMVGISPSTAYRMFRTGRLPPAVGRIGHGARLRFSRAEVIEWAQAGFPDADRWAEIKQRAGKAAAPSV